MPVVFFSVCTWYGNCTMPHVLKSVFGKKEKLLAKKTCRDMFFINAVRGKNSRELMSNLYLVSIQYCRPPHDSHSVNAITLVANLQDNPRVLTMRTGSQGRNQSCQRNQ